MPCSEALPSFHFSSPRLSSCSAETFYSQINISSISQACWLNISPPQGWVSLQPSIQGLGPDELLELFLAGRVESHPFPSGLDMVGEARAGDKIEGEAPKERQHLLGGCLETLQSWDWLHGGDRDTSPLFKPQRSLCQKVRDGKGIPLGQKPTGWSHRSLQWVSFAARM